MSVEFVYNNQKTELKRNKNKIKIKKDNRRNGNEMNFCQKVLFLIFFCFVLLCNKWRKEWIDFDFYRFRFLMPYRVCVCLWIFCGSGTKQAMAFYLLIAIDISQLSFRFHRNWSAVMLIFAFNLVCHPFAFKQSC